MAESRVADLAPLKHPLRLGPAAQEFVELWGGPLILNRWLLGVVAILVIVILVLGSVVFRQSVALAGLKPIVVRIDAVGRAEAVAYDAATWKPQTPELRYFLIQFVTKHYGRLRATIARDYPASLLFLEAHLGESLLSGGRTPAEVFLSDPGADEVDIEVRNVTFVDLSTPPYRASVDFVARSYAPTTRATPRKTQVFTAQVAFTLRDAVPNAFVPVNPLGLQISQLRVDQAFGVAE